MSTPYTAAALEAMEGAELADMLWSAHLRLPLLERLDGEARCRLTPSGHFTN